MSISTIGDHDDLPSCGCCLRGWGSRPLQHNTKHYKPELHKHGDARIYALPKWYKSGNNDCDSALCFLCNRNVCEVIIFVHQNSETRNSHLRDQHLYRLTGDSSPFQCSKAKESNHNFTNWLTPKDGAVTSVYSLKLQFTSQNTCNLKISSRACQLSRFKLLNVQINLVSGAKCCTSMDEY